MKPRYWLLLTVAVIVLVAIIADPTRVIIGTIAGDAFFQGRPARYWGRALRADPATQAEALQALEQGQADAVPALTEIFSTWRAPADADVRLKAVEVLSKLGPAAVQAAPAIAAGVGDPDVHVQAVCAKALPKLDAPADMAVPALLRLLKTENAVVAEQALSQYRGAGAPAVSDLAALLRDRNQTAEIRWNAARTIGKIGPDAAGAVDALIECLGDSEWKVREHCAEAIGELGAGAAEDGVPALTHCLSDPVSRVRRDAVRSLGHFGLAAKTAVPQIEPLLNDDEEIVREAAKTALHAVASDVSPGASADTEASADEEASESK
jgi:HEAT repeat protein